MNVIEVFKIDIEEVMDQLEDVFVSIALKRDWHHKYAKFGKQTQSLFVHSMNAFSITRVIGRPMFDLDDDELLIACTASFLHDYQKAYDSWQDAALAFMAGQRPKKTVFRHDSGMEEDLEHLKGILTEVSDNLTFDYDLEQHAARILNMIVYTHDTENRADVTRRKRMVGSIDPLTRVVRLADSIASIKTLEDIKNKEKDPDIPPEKKVSFDYHQISVVRGVVSCFLNEAIVELMKEAGYVPLLFFGNGATYLRVGDGVQIDNPREKIQDLIDNQFREFKNSSVYLQGMANAVIGPLTQMKWPSIHLVREQDVPDLVRYIASMPATNKKTAFGDGYYEEQSKKSDDYRQAMDDFVTQTGSTSRSVILAEMISDFNILVYVFDFIKSYRKLVEDNETGSKFENDVNEWFRSSSLGEFTFDGISSITHTSPVHDRVSMVTILWKIGDENLHTSKDRQKTIVNRCIKLMTNIVREYVKYAPRGISEIVSQQLISEVHYIPGELDLVEKLRDHSTSMYIRYSDGKQASKRICGLCGLPSFHEAPAGLFGDGSEKFSNFIPGGIEIGGTRKAQVCQLCMFEATLRGFYFPSAPFGTFFLLPDMSLSPSVLRLWSNAINNTIRSEQLGLGLGKVWNMLDVYKLIANGESLDTSSNLFKYIRPTTNELKDLVSFLSNMRENPKDVDFENPDNLDIEHSFEEIARSHFQGLVRIDPYLMKEYVPRTVVQRSSLLTSSYAITFLRNAPKDDPKEASSTSALRTYLLALILSEIFHARVVFVEGYQPLEQFEVKGRVNVQMPGPAENALRNQGINMTVEIHKVKGVLRILTSHMLISMGAVKNLGKDRLLRLMAMNRGAILRRAQMEHERNLPSYLKFELLHLLDNLPPKAGEL